MTHTSTELKQVLALADACAGDWEAVRPHLVVQALRDLVARVQELEKSNLSRLDVIGKLANEGAKREAKLIELEASQAQRVPMTQKQRKQLVCSYFAEPWEMEKADAMLRELERSLGITQEKQG